MTTNYQYKAQQKRLKVGLKYSTFLLLDSWVQTESGLKSGLTLTSVGLADLDSDPLDSDSDSDFGPVDSDSDSGPVDSDSHLMDSDFIFFHAFQNSPHMLKCSGSPHWVEIGLNTTLAPLFLLKHHRSNQSESMAFTRYIGPIHCYTALRGCQLQ